RLHEQARRTRDEIERAALLGALAGFRDPALAQASLALALTDQFSRQQAWHLLAPDAAVRPQAYQFVMRNFDALVARLPAGVAPRLFDLLGPLCEPADRAQVDAFFGSRVDRLGGLRPLPTSLELGAQSGAHRAQKKKSLSAFLHGSGAAAGLGQGLGTNCRARRVEPATAAERAPTPVDGR